MSSEQAQKLTEKAKKEPFVPIGIAGTLGMLGYCVYNYKNRGTMSTSVYVMQTRVMAQAVVVGAMAAGVTYSIIRDMWKKSHDHSSS